MSGGGHVPPATLVEVSPSERWHQWLTDLNRRVGAGEDLDGREELAKALAGAGLEALAVAIALPTTLTDTARRYFDTYGVVGISVADVLDHRPDLTSDQARRFLELRDNRLADAMGGYAGDILADHLSADDDIPPAPDNLDELIEARESGDPVEEQQ